MLLATEFTRVVTQNLRQNDLVIRFGGDEFILVLSGVPKTQKGYAEVVLILERIQEQYIGLHPGIFLSFSYRIAAMESNVEKTIEAADRQMYLMKEARSVFRLG